MVRIQLNTQMLFVPFLAEDLYIHICNSFDRRLNATGVDFHRRLNVTDASFDR